jgi:nondiscriminating glutamyl-tRNA synthetase
VSDTSVRARFAPSPTGHLHVGNARTALFNWLFARRAGGALLLRIEDTDLERSDPRYEDLLIADLKWLGLDWDEGPDVGGPFAPYRQSDRLPLYGEQAERLLVERKAYLCFCRPEELERERERALAEHRPPIYSGRCRDLEPAESQRRRQQGEAAAIRLRIPERPIRFHDIVHGWIEFSNEVVSDPIILRSSGVPVYNFVVVVDDALMKITHVIRGDDHLSNTPKQVALYEALGWPVPQFAHLSTILGADRERLSKRHGATSIANFREMGVLPEALDNYLALLGWAPSGGDREIFSRKELLKEFSLERVTASPAVFDMEKLFWLNRHYIKASPPEHIVELSLPYFERILPRPGASPSPPAVVEGACLDWVTNSEICSWLAKVVMLLVASVDRLDQLPDRAAFIFRFDAAATVANPENAEVLRWQHTEAVLSRFTAKVLEDESASERHLAADRFKIILNEVKAETGAKGKELFHPVRIMLTGSHSGPEFDKIVPLIEEGSRLQLSPHVLSVRERVVEFQKAKSAAA